MQEQNKALEKARDRFRNQTLDQKQEIRKLKLKIEKLEEEEQIEQNDTKYEKDIVDSNLDDSQASQNTMRSVDDKQLLSITAQIKQGVKSIKRDSTKENLSSVSTVTKNYDTFRSIKSGLSSQRLSTDTLNRKAEVINDIKSLIKDYKKDNQKY